MHSIGRSWLVPRLVGVRLSKMGSHEKKRAKKRQQKARELLKNLGDQV